MSTQDNDAVPVDLEAGPQQAMTTDPGNDGPRADDAAATAELEDRLRRALAEVDNVRKRCLRQVTDERSAERARVAAAWLPVIDNLERALEHAGSGADPVVDGVRAVRDQAVEVMARLGFPRRAETRVPFDPYRHEAVGLVEDTDAAPGEVVQVVRPGYGDGQALLRPAAVLVAAERE
jgi:molecular chaperone GrpE